MEIQPVELYIHNIFLSPVCGTYCARFTLFAILTKSILYTFPLRSRSSVIACSAHFSVLLSGMVQCLGKYSLRCIVTVKNSLVSFLNS